jgi:ferric-dicitrate binding protein FerR (iron transport regulator)
MEAHALYELLEKYRRGNCTAEELAQLDQWYATLGAERPEGLFEAGSEKALQLTRRKLRELQAAAAPRTPVVPFWKKAMRWAAVVGGVIVLAGGIRFFLQPASRQAILAKEHRIPAGHSRHITLADGSMVVLHADSRLEYPAAFSGGTREVTLVGEAYFDIRRDTARPFIIHSGSLRTTVLGTAFNIRAYEHSPEVTVSVTRGKVKVETEQERKLLAVLTPDQQVVYNNMVATAVRQPVVADSAIQWVRKDMVFENQPFSQVAQTLSSRYHINIRFKDPELEKCLIRASFKGTEPLDVVLSVVCTIRNASYTLDDDNNILITGKGCQ